MDGSISVDVATPVLDMVKSPADLRAMDDATLKLLCRELRNDTIRTVSRTGGHLGSSLGVVELTVAIHAVFETPRDKLIFDVSHQCYPHKILTGRRERMMTLRQENGLSGFTRRAESAYDPFGAAHSSTSISAGLGFAIAAELGGDPGDVVCLIGDGAMSAGLAYEAINNAGALGRRLIVILNDNGMSIAPPVGAFSNHLTRLSQRPLSPSAQARGCGKEVRVGRTLLFEELGFNYIGPIDGHDLDGVLASLRAIRADATGPTLLHAKTRKGAGYEPAEKAADKYHGVSRFDIVTGRQQVSKPAAPSFTEVFATALIAEAERDERIVAITAAMPAGTGIDLFEKKLPKRAFDVGIAEQHAVTFAAGLAAGGMKPFCAIYSTFLQRAYDQIVHDVALQNLPVRFAIDRAGLVGADGPTHAGAFDIAYLACLPNFTVMAAADEAELVHMVATAAAHDAGPIAFRYPRGEGSGIALPERGVPLEIGRGRILRHGSAVALLSFGTRLAEVLRAADELERCGLSTTVADARFAKPLDRMLLRDLVAKHAAVITVEEGAAGGFGAHVLHALAEEGLLRASELRAMCLPDVFIQQASPQAMYDRARLNACHIVEKAMEAIAAADRTMPPTWQRAQHIAWSRQ